MKLVAAISFVFLYWCYLLVSGTETDSKWDTERIKVFGSEVRQILVDRILGEFTAISDLEKKYAALKLSSIDLDSQSFVREKVDILKKILKDREDLVKKVAEEAEKLREANGLNIVAAENITFYRKKDENETQYAESGKIHYRNAKCDCGYQLPPDVESSEVDCLRASRGYNISRQFGKLPVSYEMSSVHIPTEIYNGDDDVLKDIHLSDGIDGVMREKVCVNDTYSHLTRWVYYTTHRGVMRFFPDRVWSDDCEMPDVYDSRISPWFLQSVSSPKDIAVLIDNSGSVEGLTLNLFKRSVQHFLDTLTTNDFINIILFNEKAKFIYDKCSGLLQATPRNKQILLNWMERIPIENQSNFEKGFDLALQALDKPLVNDKVYSAKCNSIVMFFTDGDASYPTDALNRWNPDGDKRVFGFTVGKHFYQTETTKEIACRNRGNYETIPSYTATKANVLKYVEKISEPLSQTLTKTVKWSLPYKDRLGLGFIMSASTPVQNKTSGKIEGVIGTDIRVDDLKKIIFDPYMGKDYYPFVLDNNGFALIHPNLVEENHDDVMSVDFLDLEHGNVATFRRDIIDGLTSTGMSTTIKEFVIDGRYLLTSSYKYEYSSISETVLKFGLAIHSTKLKYFDTNFAIATHYSDLTLAKLIKDQTSDTVSMLYSSPCPFKEQVSYNPCEVGENDTEESGFNFTEGVLLEEFSDDTCDTTSQLYSNLLLHSYLSDNIAGSSWDPNMLIKDGDGVLALFTALETPSFIRTKFLNFTKQIQDASEIDEKQLKKDIMAVLANPRDGAYMRRAIHKPSWTVYSFVDAPIIPNPVSASMSPETATTTPFMTTVSDSTTGASTLRPGVFTSAGEKKGYIIASKVVAVSDDEPTIAPVVTGTVLHQQTFQKNIFSLRYKCNESSNCNLGDMDQLCNDTENIACLILDDGGFLLASNQEKHSTKINTFFGLIDGEFMRSLVNRKVYDVYQNYDYQSVCEKQLNDNSAGIPRCFVPTVADLLSFGWWLSSCARMFIYSLFQSAIFGLFSFFDGNLSSAHAVLQPTGVMVPTKREHCILKTPILSFGPNSPMLYGSFDCTEFCERTFTSIQLENTNLLFIVAHTSEICHEDCSKVQPLSNEPTDVTLDETCGNDTSRYRVPPEDKCYDAKDLPREDDTACSSSLIFLPYYEIIAFFIIMQHMITCIFT